MTTANTTLPTEDTVTLAAGITPNSRLAELINARADIFALTQTTQDAVLRPREAGGIRYAERAALACRIARLNGTAPLAEHYHQYLIQQADADAVAHRIADPSTADSDFDDPQLAARVRHVDLVTQAPRNATRADIQALRNAGLTDADIVRLSELIAFVNYQLRLVAGLRLLGERP